MTSCFLLFSLWIVSFFFFIGEKNSLCELDWGWSDACALSSITQVRLSSWKDACARRRPQTCEHARRRLQTCEHASFRRWSKQLIRVTLDFLDYIDWLLRKLWCSSLREKSLVLPEAQNLTDSQILSVVQLLSLFPSSTNVSIRWLFLSPSGWLDLFSEWRMCCAFQLRINISTSLSETWVYSHTDF